MNWLLIEKLGLTCCFFEIGTVVYSKGFVSSLEVHGGSYLAGLRLFLGVLEDSIMVGLKLLEEKKFELLSNEDFTPAENIQLLFCRVRYITLYITY